jgi:tetratricopeptide (TPR) repeat protein
LFNLGHCYRKLQRYDEAIGAYNKALHVSPRNASTYSALGFAHHLKGQHDVAIDYYHKVHLPCTPPCTLHPAPKINTTDVAADHNKQEASR